MSQSDCMGSLRFGRCPTGKVFFVLTHVIGFVRLTLSATIEAGFRHIVYFL